MTSRTSPPPEQLTLLPEAEVPLQFRLDEATRRRGLRHIAAIRAQLERQTLHAGIRSAPAKRATEPTHPHARSHAARPAA